MYRFRMPRRGGLSVALWFALLLFGVATLWFVLFGHWWVWLPAAGISILALILLPFFTKGFVMTVGRTEVRIRRKRILQTVQRLPRRFISGTCLLSTPVQRLLGVCTVLVFTPGSIALVAGLTRRDGERLCSVLADEDKTP